MRKSIKLSIVTAIIGSLLGVWLFCQNVTRQADELLRPQIAVQCYSCGTETVFVDYNVTVANCKRCGKVMRAAGEDPGYRMPRQAYAVQ